MDHNRDMIMLLWNSESAGGKSHQSRNQTKGCNNVPVIGVIGERYVVRRELITRQTDLLRMPEETSLRS